jgi:hypothetical protein
MLLGRVNKIPGKPLEFDFFATGFVHIITECFSSYIIYYYRILLKGNLMNLKGMIIMMRINGV